MWKNKVEWTGDRWQCGAGTLLAG